MANLRSQLNTLAASFANQIMAALQEASLHELVSSGDEGSVGNGRRARVVAGGDRSQNRFPPLRRGRARTDGWPVVRLTRSQQRSTRSFFS
jgi:hypothetical protein